MKSYTTLLEEALEAWTDVRQGVIDELRNIPEKDVGFRPRPESRSVAELGQHIVQSGLLMSGELSRKDGDFRRKSYEALLREHGPGMETPADPQGPARRARAHASGGGESPPAARASSTYSSPSAASTESRGRGWPG